MNGRIRCNEVSGDDVNAPPPSVEVPVQQQQQPRVSPAVTQSTSRQRGDLGVKHGFVSMLAAREKIAMIIADQSPQHIPAPELLSCPSSELVTPDSCRKACEDEHGNVCFNAMDTECDDLYRAVTFGAVVDERGGGAWQQNGINKVSAKWVPSWKVNEFGRVVRAKTRLVARGFGQCAGVDYFEPYSPCPSIASIRLLVAIACESGLDL